MPHQGGQYSEHIPDPRPHGPTSSLLAPEERRNLVLHQQDDLDLLARLQFLLRVLIERIRLIDLRAENIQVVVGHPDVHLQATARPYDTADETRLFTQFAQGLNLGVAACRRGTCTKPNDSVLDGLAVLP